MNRIDRSGVNTQEKIVANMALIDDVIGPNRFVFRNPSLTTRAGAFAAFPSAPVNSLVIGSARIYLRIAAAGAAADFQKVTISAAD